MPRTLLLLALSQGLAISVASLIISSVALVGQDLAINPMWATVPAGMQFLATMLVMYPASILMQSRGRKYGFNLAAMCIIIAGALMAYSVVASSYWLFCAGIACAGAALGFFQYLRFTAIEVVPSAMAPKAVSWVLLGGLIAAFVGPNLAAYTRMQWPEYPFAMSYLTLIGFGLLLLLLISKMKLPLPTAEERSGETRNTWSIISQPVFIVASMGAMTAYGVMNLIMTSTPLAMHDHGFSFGQTAIIIQWHIASMFFPSFFSGHLISRFGSLRIMFIGVLILGCTVLINNSAHTMTFYWLALVCLGVGWNFLFIGSTTLLQGAWWPAEKGKVQGINDTMVYTLTTISAFAAGMLYTKLGWQDLNLLVLPMLLLMSSLIIWFALRPGGQAKAIKI